MKNVTRFFCGQLFEGEITGGFDSRSSSPLHFETIQPGRNGIFIAGDAIEPDCIICVAQRAGRDAQDQFRDRMVGLSLQLLPCLKSFVGLRK